MKNIWRFLIGLLVGIIGFFLILSIIALLSPLILGFALLGTAIVIIFWVLFSILIAFAFVFFMTRKEKPHKKNVNYSISQGKEIK
jgi:membrane protein implicated in regulation of membrane protease activity